VAFVALALLIPACGSDEPYVPSGNVRSPSPDVSGISLPESTNGDTAFFMKAPAGKLFVLYFGYTACPDICPTTMADLREALKQIGDGANRVEVGMVTVDPLRDTDAIITGYVQAFFPDGHAFRTEDPDELKAAASAFGAAYDVSFADDGTEEVIHTAFLYLVDDTGHLRLAWPFGTRSEDIARDLTEYLKET
jgi:protein SCO1/2